MEKLDYVMLTNDGRGNYGLVIQTDKGGVGDTFGKGMTAGDVAQTLRGLAGRLEASVKIREFEVARHYRKPKQAR